MVFIGRHTPAEKYPWGKRRSVIDIWSLLPMSQIRKIKLKTLIFKHNNGVLIKHIPSSVIIFGLAVPRLAGERPPTFDTNYEYAF